MGAVVTEGWHDFLVAAAGAAGALAGLVFVALSLNLGRILESQELPGRAAETIVQLAGALTAALLALIPDTTPASLGGLVIGTGTLMWAVPTRLQVLSIVRKTYYRRWFAFQRLALHQVASLPMVLAGVLVVLGARHAMDWMAGALLAAMIGALNNAWVLLVEIVR